MKNSLKKQGEFTTMRLGDIANFIDYRGKTPQKTTSGIRLVTAKNVKKGYLSLTPEEFISIDEYKNWMSRGYAKEGDILFTTEAPIGNVALLNIFEPIALAQRLITFQTNERVTNKYLFYFLLNPKFQDVLLKNSTGTTVLGIKASKLKNLEISFPTIQSQKKNRL